MKKLNIIFALITLLIVSDALAITSGRASSFGSRSVTVSRVSTPSRPVSAPTSGTSSGRSGLFGSKPTDAAKAANTTAAANNTKLYDKFKSANTKTTPVATAPVFDRTYRVNRRTQYYSDYRPAPTYQPIIVQHSNYGVWDAMMMWSILDNMGDRQMYYHHQNDPSFKEWRADAETLCRQGDKEICNKLADLDSSVNDLKHKGVKPDLAYITEGVDPNIYTTDAVSVNDIGEIKICTGSASSDYSRFSSIMADKTKLKVKYVLTNGSIDNLDKLSKGYCDMAFAQSDTIHDDNLVKALTLSSKEAILLLCNKNSNIKTADDLKSDNVVYIGSDQTGSLYSFNNLQKLGVIKPVRLQNNFPTVSAADLVKNDNNACLFAVDTWNAPYVSELDKSNKVHLTPISKKASGYIDVVIDKHHYTNLTQSNYNGFFSDGTDSLAVEPVLVSTTEWVEKNKVVFYDVMMLNKQYLQDAVK